MCGAQNICGATTSLPHIASQHPDGSSEFEAGAALIVDLLFFANSKPVHRQILSWCRSLPANKFAAVTALLVQQVNEAVAGSEHKGSEMRPIALAEPLLSLLEFKPVQLPLRQASVYYSGCVLSAGYVYTQVTINID